MTARRTAPLYTPEMLALAVSLAEFPLADDLPRRATVRSRTCGSVVTIGAATDSEGAITRVGVAASACAVGQAAAALFVRAAAGRTGAQCDAVAKALADWLAADGPMPDWPGLEILAPARAHPGRHEAVMLPWRAASDALSLDEGPR